MPDTQVLDRAEREIKALHAFLEGWLSGSLPARDDEFTAGLVSRLHPAFVNIQPAGVVLRCEELLNQIRRGYAASPDFRIRIRDVAVHHVLDEGRTILATYEEYQRGARNSARAENARLSTALFRRAADDRLTWLHIHETWLPDAKHEPAGFEF